jgi:hypothetical protein
MFCAIAEKNVIARRMKGAPEESTEDVQHEADSDGDAVTTKRVATKIRTLKKKSQKTSGAVILCNNGINLIFLFV